ncbi:MAG: hypothetical protein ACK5LV_03015 [Lachnospirales bacterium]
MSTLKNKLELAIENLNLVNLLLISDYLTNPEITLSIDEAITLPEIFKEINNVVNIHAIDIDTLLKLDEKHKTEIISKLNMLKTAFTSEMFKVHLYNNKLDSIFYKYSELHNNPTVPNTIFEKSKIESALKKYFDNIDLYEDNILVYFPNVIPLLHKVENREFIDITIRSYIKESFKNLEDAETSITYLILKSLVIPTTFDEYGDFFPEIKKEISVIDKELVVDKTQKELDKIGERISALKSKVLHTFSDINTILENLNSIISILMVNDNLDDLDDKDYLVKDLFYTSLNIAKDIEKSEVIIEKFNNSLVEQLETRIDLFNNLDKEIEELDLNTKKLTENESTLYKAYIILKDLYLSDIEKYFMHSKILLYNYNAKYCQNKDKELWDLFIDDALTIYDNLDIISQKTLTASLLNIIKYSFNQEEILQVFLDYFNEDNLSKVYEYEKLILFCNK